MFLWPDSAVEGVSSSSSKDVGSSSPVTDRKKHRRKKSMNQKGDAATGQADGKRYQLHMCFYFQSLAPPIFTEFIFLSLLTQLSAKCGNLKALVV